MHKITRLILSGAFCSLSASAAYAESAAAENAHQNTHASQEASLDSSLRNLEGSLHDAKDTLSQMGDALANAAVESWNKSQDDDAKDLKEVGNKVGTLLKDKLNDAGAVLAQQASTAVDNLSKSLKSQLNASSKSAENLKYKLEHLSTLQSDFVQEVYDVKGNVLSNSSGHLALHRPDNFLMHTDDPDEVILYVRGDSIYYYDAAVNQLSIFDIRKLSDNPFLLLTSQNELIWSEFYVSQDENRFTLVPKEAQDIKSLTIAFLNVDRPTIIDSISIRMSDGNTNFYRLKNTAVHVDDEIFNVDLPSDVDIDDER